MVYKQYMQLDIKINGVVIDMQGSKVFRLKSDFRLLQFETLENNFRNVMLQVCFHLIL